MYDPQIFYAMRDEFKLYDHHQEFKRRLYNIPIRPKIKYDYSQKALNVLESIRPKLHQQQSKK